MTIIKLFIIFIACLFGFVSCTTQTDISSPTGSLATMSVTPSPPIQTIVVPTAVEVKPTIEPSKTVTETPTTVKDNCITIIDDFGAFDITGTVVIDSEVPYLLNLSDYTKIELLNPIDGYLSINWARFPVSPDYLWLAYFIKSLNDTDSNQVMFTNSKGGLAGKFELNESNGNIIGWRDASTVLFAPEADDSKNIYGRFYEINPFTGNMILHEPDLPFLLQIDMTMWYPNTQIPIGIYNSSLTEGLYLSYNLEYILYDPISEKVLATYDGGQPLSSPVWLPDQSGVIVVRNKYHNGTNYPAEFFLISTDGSIRQLSNFSQIDPKVEFQIFEFSVSPDGRWISFWYREGPSEPVQLGLLNIGTHEFITLCLWDGDLTPVWSPNGNYLAIMRDTGEGIIDADTYILYLVNRTATLVAENGEPVGWMIDSNK